MKNTGLLTSALLLVFSAFAHENTGTPDSHKNEVKNKMAAGCAPTTSQTDIDINNVRAKILNGGDMWWDLQNNPRYEIPKGGGRHSLFAGALWIGGVDAGGQLKVAAMTYRQSGNDFFAGPLDPNAAVSTDECLKFDKHWKITRQEVEDFVTWYNASKNGGTPDPNYSVPLSISGWPGAFNDNNYSSMAPFFDNNNDGLYNYQDGDYPGYDLTGTASCVSCGNAGYKDMLFGDQTLWWIFNDEGNIHTETGGEPIGLEIQAQAFAFTTNDEINNMTFYQYKIVNKSTYTVEHTYFGQWIDPDLGGGDDDYVGCDIGRGLGYCYNGDANDEDGTGQFAGEKGYGSNPPAVGVDFFQGPLADEKDGIDNNHNCSVDEACEKIIMSKFVYYNNDFTLTGNPSTATHYYNYLQGKWKDGTRMTYGGTGHLSGGPECDFMFPDKSDQDIGWGTGGTCASPVAIQPVWNEVTSGNQPHDRRFLQSAGEFTLKPGAVNYITTGVVWARASSGGPTASVELMKIADDKAQSLFDNCFKVLDGPTAPELAIRELDKELILSISNKSTSNNYNEAYAEADPLIPARVVYSSVKDSLDTTTMQYIHIVKTDTVNFDNKYHFQGYQLFQLKDNSVSITDIHNPDKARLVAQCDLKDKVSTLTNYTFDQSVGGNVPVIEVSGADGGVTHSFRITTDAFATGNTTLINHKQYYFTVIAYAYNEYKPYRPDQPIDPNDPLAPAIDGQKKPYFAGRKNIHNYTGIPHHPAPNNDGQMLGAAYGDGPSLTRIEGQGNGGLNTDLTPETENEILASPYSRSFTPSYLGGRGPVNIKVYDPVLVPKSTFIFRLVPDTSTGSIVKGQMDTMRWEMINTADGTVVSSDRTISSGNEQLIPQWGLSVNVVQSENVGDNPLEGNGTIEATLKFADETKIWLLGVPDQDGSYIFNWIRAGGVQTNDPAGTKCKADDDYFTGAGVAIDPNGYFEQLLDGRVAPYKMCEYQRCVGTKGADFGPAWTSTTAMNSNNLAYLPGIDLVFTADKSKWTRCIVLEESSEKSLADGLVAKLSPRGGASGVSKDINGNPEAGSGMSWFPGYAINVETGERMNIMFGENSWLVGEHGNDMLWNPTSNWLSPTGTELFGGMHSVYVMESRYDSCARYKTLFDAGTNQSKINVFREAGWVATPILASEYNLPTPASIPTDLRVRVRVKKPYQPFASGPNMTSGALVPGKWYCVVMGPVTHNSKSYSTGSVFLAVNANYSANSIVTPNPIVVEAGPNKGMPYYTFSTADLFNDKSNLTVAKDAMDLINVVPNPYYAYSDYEKSATDNRIKITNLPNQCTVSIYTVNGTMVRRYIRDVGTDVSSGSGSEKINIDTSLEWDLKNTAGIPVSSGLYIIHINAGEKGEKVIKWFGVIRPIDLGTF